MKITGKMFKSEMVNAILSGKKNQTRRLDGLNIINENPDSMRLDGLNDNGYWQFTQVFPPPTLTTLTLEVKPRYRVGDIIYVKEPWAINNCQHSKEFGEAIYLSTQQIDSDYPIIKKSSMMMPKRVARIWLEITNVRIERLQDISADDANFEGIRLTPDEQSKAFMDFGFDGVREKYIDKFKDLWISINGADTWYQNHWLYVIEFKKTEKPQL